MTRNSSLPTVVVTGGASGIGEAAVRRFAAGSWNVVIADINDERGRTLEAELGSAGGTAVYRRLDVSDERAVLESARGIGEEFGSVDALVNSGGVLQNAVSTSNMKLDEYDRIMDVNVRGTLLVSRAFASLMSRTGHGSIVNLASLSSFIAFPHPAYALSKAAILRLTEIMACELGPKGVRVNAVAPGYTLTPAMQARIDKGERDPAAVVSKSAIKRFVQPSEVGEAIFFLCSPAASAITGAILPVDCGWLVYSSYSAAASQPVE